MQKLQLARMSVPVIMATGALPDEQFTRSGVQPPAKTLLKPFTFDELLAAVKEVLFASNYGREKSVPPPNWNC